MKLTMNKMIGFGSLIISYNGIDGVFEKEELNLSYQQDNLVKIAKIEEGEVKSYVTMDDAVAEFCYDHHVITIGQNTSETKKLHNKVTKIISNASEPKIGSGDRYTGKYLIRFLCEEEKRLTEDKNGTRRNC